MHGAVLGRPAGKPAYRRADAWRAKCVRARPAIWARAMRVRGALSAAKEQPDVRSDVIQDLRRQIASGRYALDPDVVAHGLLDAGAP